MALEAISGAIYHDGAKSLQRTEQINNTIAKDQNSMNINITETPAAVKVPGSNQLGSEQEKGQKDNSAAEKQLKNAISNANNKLKIHRTRCEFAYHEATKRVSIKIVDEDTKEVVKEIPPEETLEMVEKMWELAGILVDERR
jgi:flagellar protein FlaG